MVFSEEWYFSYQEKSEEYFSKNVVFTQNTYSNSLDPDARQYWNSNNAAFSNTLLQFPHWLWMVNLLYFIFSLLVRAFTSLCFNCSYLIRKKYPYHNKLSQDAWAMKNDVREVQNKTFWTNILCSHILGLNSILFFCDCISFSIWFV